ncbi:MAG: hypothetical protein WC389_15985 [Lutibacter sp.]|jgi:hypothetical protein
MKSITLKDAKITFLINRESTTIELYDPVAYVTFLEIKLTPEQLSSALSRLGHTPCTVIVEHLEAIGKKRETKNIEFPMPSLYEYNKQQAIAKELAIQNTPEGWEPDLYFGSRESFFKKGEQQYARTQIMHWIDIEEK